uniref:Methylthioribose-1-phosphate isomerase n=1 Tax=Caligus clemensi TaxID=344056 RepID=C1C2L5_CALCM|nr:Translation initiation factor eIF-2B subunit alpha/beta/delta-like protein [Caligus clemensi]
MEEVSFLRAIEYSDARLRILDQLKLPFKKEYIPILNTEDAWHCIRKMQVRGAPAIALVGCLSLAVEIRNNSAKDNRVMKSFVWDKMNYLVTARPTAVNIYKARDELRAKMDEWKEDELTNKVVEWCEGLLKADIRDNVAIGSIGSKAILETGREKKIRILTTCNTGSLATAGYGTALGVIRSLHNMKRLECAYYTETRPYNQGIRLTGFELAEDKITGTLICDNMVGLLFKTREISAVVVGADRVAANGDTANKIGTLQIAILAHYFKVPFYVAAPFSSIDKNTSHGNNIKIEERSPMEMLTCPCSNKELMASANTEVWNPAFDVTPSELITGGIITEKRLYKYPFNFE